MCRKRIHDQQHIDITVVIRVDIAGSFISGNKDRKGFIADILFTAVCGNGFLFLIGLNDAGIALYRSNALPQRLISGVGNDDRIALFIQQIADHRTVIQFFLKCHIFGFLGCSDLLFYIFTVFFVVAILD